VRARGGGGGGDLDVAERAGADRVILATAAHRPPLQRPAGRPHETLRGRWGMWLLIATEAMLFVFLFFAYFYLGLQAPRWPAAAEQPSLGYALPMLAILLASSAVLHWGELGIRRNDTARLKIGLGLTVLLGALFIVVQIFEYRSHLQTLHPRDSSYGSIFYTITSFHFLHVVVGWLMLWFVFARSLAGHFDAPRHLAVKNVTTYWHFVDLIWIFVVSILYIAPRFYGPPLP
jgi:heme/copper-type cytochrome/quinol oxidase subunit 3